MDKVTEKKETAVVATETVVIIQRLDSVESRLSAIEKPVMASKEEMKNYLRSYVFADIQATLNDNCEA